MLKKILVFVSVFFNVVVVAMVVLSFGRKTSSLSFLDLSTKEGAYTTAACVISVPENGADAVFGAAEFSLKAGTEAAIQFSLVVDARQVNLSSEALYDHEVISAEPSGYGLVIRALSPGETVLQLFAGNGIRDLARITVYE